MVVNLKFSDPYKNTIVVSEIVYPIDGEKLNSNKSAVPFFSLVSKSIKLDSLSCSLKSISFLPNWLSEFAFRAVF